jgi:hypothetical protein
MMNELALTKDERICLQTWFRQAIVQLEREEVTAQMIKEHGIKTSNEEGHRTSVVRRRTRRSSVLSHVSQLVK